MKWIVNQDRDRICKYESVYSFNIEYVYIKEMCIAFNLWYRDNFLGTFDSVEECVNEIFQIVLSKDIYYSVSGYCYNNYFNEL